MLKLAVHNVAPAEAALVQLCCKTPGQQTLTTTLLSEMVECAEAALKVILLIQTAYQDQFWLLKQELAFTTTSKHNHNLIFCCMRPDWGRGARQPHLRQLLCLCLVS